MSSLAGRRRWILETVRARGHADVTELAQRLGVAPETVRRDLNTLDGEGLVHRTHGGALPASHVEPGRAAPATPSREVERYAALADACVALLEPWESIYLDDGLAARAVAARLATTDHPLTIVTPCLAVAAALAGRPRTELYVVGGVVQHDAQSTQGPDASAMLSSLLTGVAVMTTTGVSVDHGVTTSDASRAQLKRLAMSTSRHWILLADHVSLDRPDRHPYARVKDFSVLVTDAALSDRLARKYRARTSRLLRC